MAALPAARSHAASVRAGGDASLGAMLLALRLRRLAAVLHPPHFAVDQRQPHRRPDCARDRVGDRRTDAAFARGPLPPGAGPAGAGRATSSPILTRSPAISASSTHGGWWSLARSARASTCACSADVGHFVPAGVPLLLVSRRGSDDPRPGRGADRGVRYRPDAHAAAGCRVRRHPDRRHRVARDLAGGERPEHGDQLHRPAQPHPDPLGRPRAAASRTYTNRRTCCASCCPGSTSTACSILRSSRSATTRTRDVAVSLRLLRAYADIAGTLRDPALRDVLHRRAQAVVAGCETRLPDTDLARLRGRAALLAELPR